MDHLKKDILNCLKDLKGNGKFISTGTAGFLFPGLEVDGPGEITYPVNELQAKVLIQAAHKAPFGKGSETILDKSVRSAWEIDAAKLTFSGDSWNTFLNKILSNIKQDLGLKDYTISAHLYKLLIYEKGDFFLPHKDSEKENGMFGTLVIGLPSRYTGGELVVSFEGVKEIADFAPASGDYKINYAAFYADCDHEVKPLASGYRVCLVYNLVQQKPGKKIRLTTIAAHADKLAEIFTKQRHSGNTKPHIILLGHQYTPENFSADRLKLNDRSKAEALLRAARQAGYYAKLCLVTSYLAGMPEDGGYYGYGDYEEPDENGEMAEIYDKSLSIEYWLADDIPALSNVRFEENDLITSFALNDDEPIVKESTGYMGNYGPDLMHWYHYGAVMIWSPETNAQLLLQQETASKLQWIGYFNKIPQVSDGEVSAAEAILSTGLSHTEFDKDADYNAIADWVINRKDETFFLRQDDALRQFYFTKIDAAHWLKLAGFFKSDVAEDIFSRVTQDISLPVVEKLLAVLRTLSVSGKFDSLVAAQIKKLPLYFDALVANPGKVQFPATAGSLSDLFWLDKKLPQDKTWVTRMAEALTKHSARGYINGVLVPQLLALREGTELTDELLLICRKYLQERADNEPQPPADWSRRVPATGDKKQWQLLRSFLESPDEQVFDYRKNQSERNERENAIKRDVIDLTTETIKKGSPHTLRIIKTQAAYHRAMKCWKEDLGLLDKIMRTTEG